MGCREGHVRVVGVRSCLAVVRAADSPALERLPELPAELRYAQDDRPQISRPILHLYVVDFQAVPLVLETPVSIV